MFRKNLHSGAEVVNWVLSLATITLFILHWIAGPAAQLLFIVAVIWIAYSVIKWLLNSTRDKPHH